MPQPLWELMSSGSQSAGTGRTNIKIQEAGWPIDALPMNTACIVSCPHSGVSQRTVRSWLAQMHTHLQRDKWQNIRYKSPQPSHALTAEEARIPQRNALQICIQLSVYQEEIRITMRTAWRGRNNPLKHLWELSSLRLPLWVFPEVELNSFCCSATASSCQIFILALSSTTSASMCCENAVSTTRLPQVISSLSSPWSMSLSWNFQQFHLPAASHVEACSFEYAVCVKKIVTSSLETLKECFFCPYCLT